MMDYGAVNVQDSSSYFKIWIYEYLNLTWLPESLKTFVTVSKF